MENRKDLNSILPFLPVFLRSSSLFWPPQVVEALKSLSGGPNSSNVNSGELFFLAISDIRNSLSLSSECLTSFAADGYALFFDDLLSRAEAAKWFGEILPELAKLLLRLPALLEYHYQNADGTGLRLLESQEAGLVVLTQELVGALLACSLFCLFPTTDRGPKHLPAINFDKLFASVYDSYNEKQENKIKCIINYFERICSHMPEGNISFERKVLPWKQSTLSISYPKASFWSKSLVSLCTFQVNVSGLIEDQLREALEVDFANKYIGGGALHRGCVQEEIRFVINPELIAGMLFLPSMADNEAIEIVGAERFSNYTGYASSFRFSGSHVDERDVDNLWRRKTRIIAIDAKSSPGKRQYEVEYLIREINKAFCGFIDQSKFQMYHKLLYEEGSFESHHGQNVEMQNSMSENDHMLNETPSTSLKENKEIISDELFKNSVKMSSQYVDHQTEIGIATGNWGCGAFGGDPEIKAIIQWLAASQALRPFISYYTCGIEELWSLDEVTQWITSHRWSVGDLWNMLVEYSCQRLKGKANIGFCNWLLPSLSAHDPMDYS